MAGAFMVVGVQTLRTQSTNMRSEQQEQVPMGSPASASLALVRGSRPRTLARLESRKLIERRTHSLVIDVTGSAPPDGLLYDFYADLRRGQRRVYGSLLRFIDDSVRRGVSRQILRLIPGWIAEYIDSQFGGGDDGGSPVQQRAA